MSGLFELYEEERRRLSHIADDKGDYANPVFGEGELNSRIVFIGEAPGKSEAESGRPFVGKAGAELDGMLDMSGIKRNELFVTNAVKFRPWKKTELASGRISTRNRTPSVNEIRESAVLLFNELKLIKPQFVVTLGNSPLYAIECVTKTKLDGSIGAFHGKEIHVSGNGLEFILFPLYHPASGIYNRALVKVMEDDLKKLSCVIKNSGK